MRALITNFGTLGDLQPLLALGVELRQHGHEVTFAYAAHFQTRIEQFGFGFLPLGSNSHSVNNDIVRAFAENTAPDLVALFTPLAAALPEAYETLCRYCENADVLICGPNLPAGRMVHETTAIPFVSVQFTYFGQSAAHKLQQVGKQLINPIRGRYGLPALENPLSLDANSPQLALFTMSRFVRPPEPTWPPHYQVTGPFFLDSDPWQPERSLVDFLEAGSAPIMVTFGSATHADPAALTQTLVTAVEQAGCRAILHDGWSGLGQVTLPPSIYAIGYANHHWLFPRTAGVVHHGGAGTAMTVLRAGVPQLVVPHNTLNDQGYWGHLCEALGVGGPTIPIADLTADRMTDALRHLLTEPSYTRNAAALGQALRSESGVRQARLLIEALMRRTTPPPPADIPRDTHLQRRALQAQARRRRIGATE